MKYALILFFALLALPGTSQSTAARTVFADAYDYNDYIVAQQDVVMECFDVFAALLYDSTSTKAEASKKRVELLQKVRTCESNVKNLPDWKGNTSLRDSAAACFAYYTKTFEVEYVELISLWYTTPYTETESEKVDALTDRINRKQDRLDDSLIRTQEAFAKQFGLIFEDDLPQD